jgi:hypothetical protein
MGQNKTPGVRSKLDADSLVLQLTVYGDGWNDYTLRLKRK